jgi:hypothetical protein
LLGQVRDELVRTIEQFRGLIEELSEFGEAWIVQGAIAVRTVGSAVKRESKRDYSGGAS